MPKPKTKRKWIDRKNAQHFSLVHRSQRDPLVADETAPQHVLVPVNAVVPCASKKKPELTLAQRKEEQMKYGVYFDDDYNYLQHLKDTREVTLLLAPKQTHKRKMKSEELVDGPLGSAAGKLKLPSSVFASEVEEDVGLLNKAAPQGLCLEVDPDVVAALDEDFDFDDPENQLEDNFIQLAMAEGSGDDEDDSWQTDDDSDAACASDLDSDGDMGIQGDGGRMPFWNKFREEETKSHFSEYSMSSSVIRRNKGLTLLDDRFEKMFAEYDDTELGALDCEEIEGFLPDTHDALLKAAEEFMDSTQRNKRGKEKELGRLERLQEIAEEASDEEELVTVPVEPKEKWDCESILSTYSNLYNHPKLIEEPKGDGGRMPFWNKFREEETKSHFSEYSMSSSVIRRNKGLTLLDDRFEKMFAEYDDTELGALDCEEIEGFLPDTHDALLKAAEEFMDSTQRNKRGKEKELGRLERLQEIAEEASDEEELVTVPVEPKEKWDCESILSTYSNLYNHPKLIEEPKKPKKITINAKTGIPADTLGKDNRLTIKSLAKFNALNELSEKDTDEEGKTHAESVLSTLSVLSIRPKDETPEEKRDRKMLLREYRKERRLEKKANKEAFKEERKRQEKIMLNNRNNVQGNRIL